tara:strand:- start:11173 stop:11409 length:237 start_codon:yes stop_codon:yes gene_type:complete
MMEIDSNYDLIDDTIIEFKRETAYIRSRVHKNIIVSFDRKLYWLAKMCVVMLNKLDHRDKPLEINNFYIEGINDEPTN